MSESSGEALVDLIRREKERLRSDVKAVVEAVVSLSEKGVMSASERVRVLNEEARQKLGELQLGAEQSFQGQALATQIIETQTRFNMDTAGRLRRQLSAAQRSLALVEDIRKLATAINQISDAARMLTINGHIEAARLGNEGAGFRVIATELRELSRSVRTTNASITDITAGLADLIPGIAREAASLLTTTEQFSEQQVSLINNFHQSAEASQQAMANIAGTAKEWAERVVTHSISLLSDLSFQDCIAQDLQDVDPLIRRSGAVVEGIVQEAAPSAVPDAARVEEIRAAVPIQSTRLGQKLDDSRTKKKTGKLMLL